MSIICPFKKTVCKLADFGIIADGERDKRNFLITCAIVEALCLAAEGFGAFLADRSIYHTCLTEAATANTSAIGFKNNSVMYGFDIRHNQLLGIRNLIKVLDYALFNFSWSVLILWLILLDSSVLVIGNLIKRRYIHALNMRCGAKEALTGIGAVFFHFNIKVGDFKKHLLTLTDIDKVEEFCNGLGIIYAGAATDNDGTVLFPLARPDGYASKL